MTDLSQPLTEAAGGSWILRWLLVIVLALIALILILLLTGYEFTVGSAKFRIGRPAPATQTAATREELAAALANCVHYDESVNLVSAHAKPPGALREFGPNEATKTEKYNPNSAVQRWILKRSQ